QSANTVVTATTLARLSTSANTIALTTRISTSVAPAPAVLYISQTIVAQSNTTTIIAGTISALLIIIVVAVISVVLVRNQKKRQVQHRQRQQEEEPQANNLPPPPYFSKSILPPPPYPEMLSVSSLPGYQSEKPDLTVEDIEDVN
ncbi:unnamed protein product, partial [Didymodactylos carnosus]